VKNIMFDGRHAESEIYNVIQIIRDSYSLGVSQNRQRYTGFFYSNHEFDQKVEIWQNMENGIAKGQPSAT